MYTGVNTERGGGKSGKKSVLTVEVGGGAINEPALVAAALNNHFVTVFDRLL